MIIQKHDEPYFRSKSGKYERSLVTYRRKNTNRMFVDGKYVPKAHPLHMPGTFKNWSEVRAQTPVEIVAEDIEAEDGLAYDYADFIQSQKKPGFVYVITNPAWPEWVKIGHSRNPARRLDNYQTGAPARDYELHGYVYFSDRYTAEHEIHERVRPISYQSEGEWFMVDVGVAMDIVSEVSEDMD